MFTHKEFDLTTGASSAEESIVHTCMIVQKYIGRNNTVGMEYNTNIRKKQKLINVQYTEIEV